MVVTMARVVDKKKKVKEKKVEAIIIGKKNITWFLVGLVMIILGYFFMAQPPVYGFMSLHLAPIILIIAYLIVFPIAIMIRDKKQES
jgi:membrane protein YdbS with pleckstrin-like domain